MAGYCGYSKSNNAINAEESGIFPASVLAKKLRVSTAAIKNIMRPSEWHHSSKFYNAVDYYDGAALISVCKGNRETFDWVDDHDFEEAKDILKQLREFKDPCTSEVKKYENCTVEWIEWTGSRNYPKANKKTIEGATVHVKSQTATIYPQDGKPFKKRLTTKGFDFRTE